MWAECTEACFASDAAFTAACFDQCEAANPQGQALYQAIYDCLCMTCSTGSLRLRPGGPVCVAVRFHKKLMRT